jgi:flagellar hook-associated protein 2
MGGLINIGGLVSGLDSNTLIRQLMDLERAPVRRMQGQITALTNQRNALRDARNLLLTLRNRLQDARNNNVFNTYAATSSNTNVLAATISGANPTAGAFSVNVTQLATATTARSSSRLGASIDPNAPLASSGFSTAVTSGTFTINGVQFNIDPSTQSLNDIINLINTSSAGVTASYDGSSDTFTLENSAPGNTALINLGANGDTSNFLAAVNITQATQTTNTNGSTQVTSTRNLGAVNPSAVLNTVNFANGAITAGTFSINGVSITIDPSTDTLASVIARINNSDAKVTAAYDATRDMITLTSRVLGSRDIAFGAPGDTSNFLSVVNLDTAVQTTGNDAQFSINGGPTQTRNSNEISDAIPGVTLRLLAQGSSTVTVGFDNNRVVETIQGIVQAYNDATGRLRALTRQGGALEGDGTLRTVEDYLRSNIFNTVSGLTGDFQSLADIGITTGATFDPQATPTLQVDETKLRAALTSQRDNVAGLFFNSNGNGIGDILLSYTDGVTAVNGPLDTRSRANGTIDQQISSINDSIRRMEDRLAQREARLRRQFTQMEQLIASFRNQGGALTGLGQGFTNLTQ